MKTFKHYLYLAAMLLVGVTLGSCSDDTTDPVDPEPPVVNDPTIVLAAGEATDTTLSFTITPEYADEVRYAYFEAGEELPYYADLIASATVAEVAAKTYLIKDLKPETTYVIVAAAAGNGKIVGDKLEMTTAEEPEVPITVAIELKAGEVKPLSLSFTYTTTDATAARWAAYEKGTPAPAIEDVIADGIELNIEEPAAVVVREGIKPETTYVILGVATDGEHNVFNEVEITTPKAELTFTEAYKIESSSSGDAGSYIQFAGNADYVLELDFWYAATPTAYVPAGTYTYSVTGSDMAIGAYSLMKHKDGENTLDEPKVKFSAGTVVVEITPENTYKFTFDLSMAVEGDEIPGRITGSYEGAVNGMEVTPGQGSDPDPEFPEMPEIPADAVELPAMTVAAWVLYSTDYVSLSFMDDKPSANFTADLVIPTTQALQPGLYSVENGSMLSSSCSETLTDSYEEAAVGSWTYVAKDAAGVYTIDMVIVTPDGKKAHTQFVGSTILEMPGESGGEAQEIELNADYANGKMMSAGKEAYLKFGGVDSKMSDYVLILDLYMEESGTTMPESAMYVLGGTGAGEMDKAYSSYEGYNDNAPYNTNGDVIRFEDGMVSIDYIDGAWEVYWDITLTDGTYLTGGYMGQISGINDPVDVTPEPADKAFTSAVYDGVSDLGSSIVNFSNADGTTTFKLAFIPYADTYEGTYTPGYMSRPGELDYFSSLYIYAGGDEAGYMPSNSGNSVTFTKSGDNWKVDFNIVNFQGSDEQLVCTYEGAIEGLPELGGGSGTTGELFTQAVFSNPDDGIYRIELMNSTGEHYVTLGFKAAADNYAGTYTIADGTLVQSFTKNMGWSSVSFTGDTATAGTLTIATSEKGWKVDFDLTFDSYTLKDGYEGEISGMGRGGAAIVVTPLVYEECTLYSRDTGEDCDGTEMDGLVSADLDDGTNELQISFYPTELSALAGTYSLADGSMAGQGVWGKWTRFNGVVPDTATMTLTATDTTDLYTLTAEFTIGDDQYTVTCSNAVYVVPVAPDAGGLSR